MAALLLALELGRPGQALEGLQPIALITLLAAGATASFVVYYAIAG